MCLFIVLVALLLLSAVVINRTTELDFLENFSEDKLIYELLHHEHTDDYFSKFIHFYLFPFSESPNSHEEIRLNDIQTLHQSHFKPKLKTIIIIHGFWPNGTDFTPLELTHAYLKTDLEHNNIYLDWSELATPGNTRDLLSIAAAYPKIVFDYIPLVSKTLTNFVNTLVDENYVQLEDIHIVGYSLGAHVAGCAGKLIQITNNGRKLGRITGLDPATPLFTNWLPLGTHRLNRNDAKFVDVYHTSMNTFGVHRQDGHVDFYPNDGRSPQPGCLLQEIKKPLVCSHLFVVKLYIETIRKNFVACRCEPFIDLIVGVICMGGCKNTLLAGEHCPTSARGQYYFTTTSAI